VSFFNLSSLGRLFSGYGIKILRRKHEWKSSLRVLARRVA
jgi:hypothetical protein